MSAERRFRWLTPVSAGLLVVGAILFLAAFSMSPRMPSYVFPAGLGMLILALVLRAVVLLGRLWDRLTNQPACRGPGPAAYKCPTCGYALRGVEGAYCPECGTVRPAPIDSENPA